MRVAERDAQPAGAELDRFGRHVLDPLDHGDRHQRACAPSRVRNSSAGGPSPRPPAGAARLRPRRRCRWSASPALAAMPGRIEQQDRPAVVGERRAGIEAGGHHRRRGRLHHQFLMVVDRVDGERIDVAAGRLQQDQALLRRVGRRLDGRATREDRRAARAGRGRWRPRRRRRVSIRTAPPLTRTISSIAERGMAKTWPPALTVSAGMMVRVSGTRMVSRTPCPGRLSMSTTPPIRSILARTTSMPTPRPEMAVTSRGGRKAGLEDQGGLLRRATAARPVRRSGCRRRPPLRTSLSPSMPRPSSAISIRIWLPAWRAQTAKRAGLRLAGRGAARPGSRCRGRSRCGRCG